MINVILRPVVTEKMTTINEKFSNRVAFIVDKRANKIQINQAVKDLYGVNVEEVNTMNYLGKNKSRYTKSGYISGKTNARKKAVITLAEGEVIDFYSNI
jgi:large subunit ribosomal protein L23